LTSQPINAPHSNIKPMHKLIRLHILTLLTKIALLSKISGYYEIGLDVTEPLCVYFR
jgi:hypothetical protein